jgi:hypothetical protein
LVYTASTGHIGTASIWALLDGPTSYSALALITLLLQIPSIFGVQSTRTLSFPQTLFQSIRTITEAARDVSLCCRKHQVHRDFPLSSELRPLFHRNPGESVSCFTYLGW